MDTQRRVTFWFGPDSDVRYLLQPPKVGDYISHGFDDTAEALGVVQEPSEVEHVFVAYGDACEIHQAEVPSERATSNRCEAGLLGARPSTRT
jgi:hypothetical protein